MVASVRRSLGPGDMRDNERKLLRTSLLCLHIARVRRLEGGNQGRSSLSQTITPSGVRSSLISHSLSSDATGGQLARPAVADDGPQVGQGRATTMQRSSNARSFVAAANL
jgi:hypothetical protein